MEKGHSFIEILVLSAIICMTIFTGFEILLRANEIKNKALLNYFLTRCALEKIEELKDKLKRGEKIESFSDQLKDSFTLRKVFREWKLEEKGELIEIKVYVFPPEKKGRKVELSNSFWKRGGF